MIVRRPLLTKTGCRLFFAVIAALALSSAPSWAAPNSPAPLIESVQSLLKLRLNRNQSGTTAAVQGQTLASALMVRSFYRQRNYLPAWMDSDGSCRRIGDLLAAVADLRHEALIPDQYHLALLERLQNDAQSSGLLREKLRLERIVDMELLATDAYLTSARHLLSGRISPETLGPDQQAVRKETDLIAALETAVESGRVQPMLSSFLPDHSGYRRLRRALKHYRRIAENGGWNSLASDAVLRMGMKDPRVAALRSRLTMEGYHSDGKPREVTRFDASLKRAVADFQRQHGLAADGVMGPATAAALNVPAFRRARQIELNMERWRWLPRYLGKRYLLVNIADYELEIIDSERRVMAMRVVVGKNYRRTPVFSAKLSKIVLNPHWYVPQTIFAEDLLPVIRANPDYLQQRGYKVFSSLKPGAEEIDPQRIDWQAVDPQAFPHILRRDPGPSNPMGRAKFLFPNRYDVYMHDSPDRSVFARAKRTFSSGCIRIEKPIELAQYLLRDSSGWSRQRIVAVIGSGRPELVAAFDSMPVHIQYWTAWVDQNSNVQFREDIYGRDALLEESLFRTPDS